MKILVAIFCLLSISAMAGGVTFRVTLPTHCAVPAGRPVAECPVTAVSIERSRQDVIDFAEVLSLPPTSFPYKWIEAPGKYLFRARAVSGTAKSEPSKSLPFEVKEATPVPGPVLDFSVTGDLTAFQLNGGTNNKIYFSSIGTVPADTKCNSAFKVMDKYMIADRNKAILKAGQTERPRQIYAWCS